MPSSATADEQRQTIHTYTGKCIDVSGSSPDAGAQIVQDRCTNAPSQKFFFDPEVPYIQNVYTFMDKCWDVAGENVHNGLIQWPCGPDKENQEFRFVLRGNERFEIRTGYGDWCLTAAGTANRARMEFSPCDGGLKQQFTAS